MKLTGHGLDFIKCAFASPDFNTDPGKGIPDDFQGKVLVKKHVLTQSITFTENKQTLILVAPIPGMAFWKAEIDSGASFGGQSLSGVAYPGFTQLFGSSADDLASNVTAFRFASMAVGIYPTSNQFQFSGSVQAFKLPLKEVMNSFTKPIGTDPVTELDVTTRIVSGLEGLDSMPADNFSGSFIDGVFSQSTCNEPEFEFRPIVEGYDVVPTTNVTLAQAGQFAALSSGPTGAYTGMGDMDAIALLIETPTGAINTAVIKVWSCVEYRPNTNSTLYEFAGDSPQRDPVALDAYRAIAKEIPVAVRADQNATFWERVKRILGAGLNFASSLPGPVGQVATGVRGLADAIHSMLI